VIVSNFASSSTASSSQVGSKAVLLLHRQFQVFQLSVSVTGPKVLQP
jgi:hypothetical protein